MNQIRRREFINLSLLTTGSLLLGFKSCNTKDEPTTGHPFNVFLQIDTKGIVTFYCPVPELGQGVRKSLAMIVAEELEANWKDVRIEQAMAHEKFGGMAAAGSDSIADYWEPLRKAGATTREMLLIAAANKWNVPPEDCYASQGKIFHKPSGKRESYASLAADAALLEVPSDVRLKDQIDFRLIGESPQSPDSKRTVTGADDYGLDLQIPGMRIVVIERCPVSGGKLVKYNGTESLKVPGVLQVFENEGRNIPGLPYAEVRAGVGVVAENTWAAMKARDLLEIEWDMGTQINPDNQIIVAHCKGLLNKPGEYVLREEGRFDHQYNRSAAKLDVIYQTPFLPHLTMEPMNFAADTGDDYCHVWGPNQNPRLIQDLLAAVCKMDKDSVKVHTSRSGGGFGRRLAIDYALEAALVSRQMGHPVKVVWTREDDVKHDFFRTFSQHRVRAGLNETGDLTCWHHHIITKPIGDGPIYEVQGAADIPLAVPHVKVEYTPLESSIRIGSWRSVAHSFNCFVVNSVIDEIARLNDQDPFQLHYSLLVQEDEVVIKLPLPGRRGNVRCDINRAKKILAAVARLAKWQQPVSKSIGRGMAWAFYKNTYVAHVAEVIGSEGGRMKVSKVFAALDCGRPIDPSGIRAQVEGAVMDAIAVVFKSELDFQNGSPIQQNFQTYDWTRMDDCPEIEVEIVNSSEAPGGAGEPPFPSAVPAICNAIYDLTGKRIRRLPVQI